MKKTKKIFLILFSVLIALFVIFSSTNVAFAANGSYSDSEMVELINDESNSIIRWGLQMIRVVYADSAIGSVEDLIGVDTSNSNSVGGAIFAFSKTTYESVASVGWGLLLLYFIIDIVEKATHENANIEFLLRASIKLIIGVCVINAGFKLIEALMTFASALIDQVFPSKSFANSDALAAARYTVAQPLLEKQGFFQSKTISAMGVIGQLLLPWVFMWICSLVAKIVCYGRYLELGLRTAFAPVGMADFFVDGVKGNGFRYLKKIFAVMLQGLFIVGTLKLYQTITSFVLNNFTGTDPLIIIVVAFSAVTLLVKTQPLANDLVGV